jgi:hypothetical protein
MSSTLASGAWKAVAIPRLQVAVQETAAGAVEGVGAQDLVARAEQRGQGHGDGGEAGGHQPGADGALEIGEGGAQLAGGGQVLDAVDRAGGGVAHGVGPVVEQGRGALDGRADRAAAEAAAGGGGDQAGAVGVVWHEGRRGLR